MPTRGLILATACLAILGGLIWWTSREKSPEDLAKESTSKSRKLLSPLEADLVEIRIMPKGGAPRIFTKDQSTNSWILESMRAVEPGFRTDYDAATSTANNAAIFPTDKTVDENATDLIQYGLDPPQVVITVKDKSGKTDTVHLGDATPVGMMVYAAKPGEKKVYTVAKYLYEGVTKPLEEYRDKRLTPFAEGKISQLEITQPGKTLKLGKNGGGEWQVVTPDPMRADNLGVQELVRKLQEAKYATRLTGAEAKQSLGRFQGAQPAVTFNITDASGAMKLEVRKTKEDKYLAKSTEHEAAYELEEEIAKTLTKDLEEYRNKKLFTFGFDDIDRVEVKKDGKTTLLEKKGSDWQLSGKKADAATVQPVVDQLRAMAALKFAKQKMTTAFLEIQTRREGTNSTETVLVSKDGNFYFAQRKGEATEYEMDPQVIRDFESALGAVKLEGTKK
ncbi:MAG: DUF4340 domain-containing protein [Bryobacter sp.]|nr:DUF4340 domain-containing protein [Bryobacter sp.]